MSLTKKIGFAYRHEQASASTTWTIVHNLGSYPVVDAYVTESSVEQRILPVDVVYNDTNTCTVVFSTPRTGFAVVAG